MFRLFIHAVGSRFILGKAPKQNPCLDAAFGKIWYHVMFYAN